MKKNFFSIIFCIIWLGCTLIYFEADFYKYCFTSQSYTISTGIIDHVDDYELNFKKYGAFFVKRAVVSYNVDGKEYRAFNVSMSYKEKEGSVIQIGINKNDPTKILRNEFLPLSKWAQFGNILCLFYLLYAYGFIKMPLYGLVKRKKQERISNQVWETEHKKQHNMESQIAKKQEKLLHILKSEGAKDKTDTEKIMVCMLEYEIQCNSDWLWCLNKFYPKGVFLLGKENGEYKFITLTLKLRELGLPLEYYVIGQENEYFYCCRCDSMRVYAFSKSLGITNTPYADIYDYLIKVFDKENNDEI